MPATEDAAIVKPGPPEALGIPLPEIDGWQPLLVVPAVQKLAPERLFS